MVALLLLLSTAALASDGLIPDTGSAALSGLASILAALAVLATMLSQTRTAERISRLEARLATVDERGKRLDRVGNKLGTDLAVVNVRLEHIATALEGGD